MSQDIRGFESLPFRHPASSSTTPRLAVYKKERADVSRRSPKGEDGRMEFAMFYVYILESELSPETYYIGITDNLERRFQEHNTGKSIHTNKFRPWFFKNTFGFNDKIKAEHFEKYLKSHSGRAFTRKHF